ncbi:hypothetical protein L1987_34233 [Smallanthus sonchifolius]|uniref:Uncharacterized protein n=1 Tax=Smallanthus sonchifolius TaxID=185202 RepID=A0ACB9HTN0_9ASTR|nr:hypothetical protein L1987_34233 [Smallanthus sonchifolius]
MPEPVRHSSYTPQSQFKTPNNRPNRLKAASKVQQTGADLGFPLMLKPNHVLKFMRFKDSLPQWIHPYVSKIKYERPDGNCGFRGIAMALGRDQNEWAWVRRKMLTEMDNNISYWRPNFEPRDAWIL